MNRIDIKLGAAIILLLISILLPLGFVLNQIFYGFYINQAQEETLTLSAQYASLLNENEAENRLGVVEVAARISNQKMVVLSEEGHVLAHSHMVMSEDDINYFMERLNVADDQPYITNSFKTTEGLTYLATASLIELDNIVGHVIVFSPLERILQSLQTVQNLVFLAAIGSLLFGVGLTIFISRKLSQPLVKMESAARQIAKGQLDTRIEEQSSDELGSLARAINDLAADLKRINEQRREFFANISHELRTPMTYLKGYAKVLREGLWKTEEEKNQYLNIIEHEATRLTYLVDDLFDLAQMDEGKFTLQRTSVQLNEMIKLILEKTSYKAAQKDIALHFHCEATNQEDTRITVDPLRIEQALLNIVENAIRYSDHGEIHVFVISEPEHVNIRITDTGVGIEKEELPYIFDRFYRVEKSRSREFGGTGLGLSIVKQLIELHNGTIEVDSTVGKGTTVTIILPKSIDERGMEGK